MPGLKFGLQLGTRRLSTRVGGDAARGLLAGSKTFGAVEALDIGFLRQVAPAEAWPGLVLRAADEAQQLSIIAAAKLQAATVTDTRAEDLADLVRSAADPGLKERIREYRKR